MIWDIVILSVLGLGFALGIWHGLIKEIASFGGLLLAVYMAGVFAVDFQPVTEKVFGQTGSYMLAWVLVFALCMCGVMLAARIVTKMIEVVALGIINRIAGGFFGLLKNALILSLCLNILAFIEKDINLSQIGERNKSRSYEIVKGIVPAVFPYVKKWTDAYMDKGGITAPDDAVQV